MAVLRTLRGASSRHGSPAGVRHPLWSGAQDSTWLPTPLPSRWSGCSRVIPGNAARHRDVLSGEHKVEVTTFSREGRYLTDGGRAPSPSSPTSRRPGAPQLHGERIAWDPIAGVCATPFSGAETCGGAGSVGDPWHPFAEDGLAPASGGDSLPARLGSTATGGDPEALDFRRVAMERVPTAESSCSFAGAPRQPAALCCCLRTLAHRAGALESVNFAQITITAGRVAAYSPAGGCRGARLSCARGAAALARSAQRAP